MAGNTQDQIARKLNVSRQAAQRLVAAAVAEGLITFRLDHPITACIELAEALQTRFGLDYVEVVPGDADVDGLVGIASAAARQVEAHLARQDADHPGLQHRQDLARHGRPGRPDGAAAAHRGLPGRAR